MVEEKVDLKTANLVYKQLCGALDDLEWTYTKDIEKLCVNFKIRGKHMPMEIKIKVNAERRLVLLLSLIPVEVAKNRRRAVGVAVSQANYRICDGSFDYSYLNGEIIFRMTLGYNGCNVGKEMIKYMISCACGTIDIMNNKFKVVAENNMTLDQIVEFM